MQAAISARLGRVLGPPRHARRSTASASQRWPDPVGWISGWEGLGKARGGVGAAEELGLAAPVRPAGPAIGPDRVV